MKFEDFAAGYPAELAEHEIYYGDQDAALHSARTWSYTIGRATHALLSNQCPNEDVLMTHQKWSDYRTWLAGHGVVETAMAMDTLDTETRARAYNEVNFHCMNSDMTGMWIPLWYEKSWGPDPNFRRNWISSAQEGLARSGLMLYMVRQQYIEQRGGTEKIYESGDVIYRARTGAMQEFDAAIVLLDVMRKYLDITIVPAPMQFERSSKPYRNVDFLALHGGNKTAVGIQVRSRLKKEDHNKADPDRVIFLDGDTDLGNIRAVRVKERSSLERVVPWPGIIAAKYIDRIKMHGKNKNKRAARNPQRTLYEKFIARKLVGDIDVDFRDISDLIGRRIMQKLEES